MFLANIFFAPFFLSEGCPKKYSHFLRTSPFTQRSIYILYGDFAGTKLAFMNQESGLSIFDIITNTTTQIMDNTVFVRIYNQIFRIDILYCSEITEDSAVLSLS